jgi:hypothetical protein
MSVRLCWSHPQPLPDHLMSYDIRAAVLQLPDGRVVEEPSVCVGQYEHSLSDARLIAQALIAAADVGEGMLGQ